MLRTTPLALLLLANWLLLCRAIPATGGVGDGSRHSSLVPDSDVPFNVTFSVVATVGERSESFVVEVHPEWAPIGAARFRALVDADFFHNQRFWRVSPGAFAQFGIAARPDVQKNWHYARLKDEPVKHSNLRGTLAFNFDQREWFRQDSRTTDLFFNLVDAAAQDGQGFAPFAKVVGDGMQVVDRLFGGYVAPIPDPYRIEHEGTRYLKTEFPKLSVLNSVAHRPR